jgi:hypothetical protein
MIMRSVAFAGIAASVLALAACSAAGGQQTPAASAPSPVVYDCAGYPQTRPASYTLACGDAGIVLTRISWSSWSATGARGSGQLGVNDCQPTCAAGKFVSTPTSITLSAPHTGQGKRYFTHLSTSATAAGPNMRNWTLGLRGPA